MCAYYKGGLQITLESGGFLLWLHSGEGKNPVAAHSTKWADPASSASSEDLEAPEESLV